MQSQEKENRNTLTILTCTYNRIRYLERLYQSLITQTMKDFEWLVVDDGSMDDTVATIANWQTNNVIQIRLITKTNGGKHTALNRGISTVNSDLVFIVDSDDYLANNAVEQILKIHNEYKADDLCGYSFCRISANGRLQHKGMIPEEGYKSDYVACRLNHNLSGDMAEVWYTKCLKEYPFPEYEGERFLGEDVVWIRMAEKYKMRFFNEAIYISDYLEDGLTKQRRVHNIQSPKGCVERAQVFLNSDANFKYKIKAMLQYQIYGNFAGRERKDLFDKCDYKCLFIILCIPSIILTTKWKKAKI